MLGGGAGKCQTLSGTDAEAANARHSQGSKGSKGRRAPAPDARKMLVSAPGVEPGTY